MKTTCKTNPLFASVEKSSSSAASITTEATTVDGESSDHDSNEKQLDFSQLNGKLYGRAKEESKLLKTYHRLLTKQTSSSTKNRKRKPELILISGPSGSGKSSLSQILREPVQSRGGSFITAKFDQLKHPDSFGPIISAFTEYLDIVVSKGTIDSIKETRKAIVDEVDGDIGILTGMIPGLEAIVGEQQHKNDQMHQVAQGSDSTSRFLHACQRFVRAVCSPEHPLVFFLDDMQWADPCSLELFNSLLQDEESNSIIFVAACRSEIAKDSPWHEFKRTMEIDGIVVKNIEIGNLSEKAVHQLVGDLLNLPSRHSKSLSQISWLQTKGNPLFLVEFFRSLEYESLLTLDGETQTWTWDEQKILLNERCCGHTDVLELISGKIEKLSKSLKELLKIASCIGASFDGAVLKSSASRSIKKPLSLAVQKELLVFDTQAGKYKFVHDRIQQAAYSLIPESERPMFHLAVGRNLLRQLSSVLLEKHVFVVLNQFIRGANLLDSQTEKYRIASLCLSALIKATKKSAFRLSSQYADFGISLLGMWGWKDEYDLTLALYSSACEVQSCTGNFDKLDSFVEEIFRHAHSLEDKVRAYVIKVYSLGGRNRQQEAIKIGLEVLYQLGEPFPARVKKAHVLADIVRTKWLLRRKTDESLSRLPRMTNPSKVASMQILNVVMLSCHRESNALLPLINLRMVQLTLKYGLSALSSVAFSTYGMILCGVMNDFDGGYRYGQLGLSFLEKDSVREYIPRVYAAHYGTVHHWKRPLSLSLKPLYESHKIALETGDIEFAMLNFFIYCLCSFYSETLGLVEEICRRGVELMKSHKQHSTLVEAQIFLQFILNLRGESVDPLVLTGEVMDQESVLREHMANDMNSVEYVSVHRMQLAYLMDEPSIAAELVKKLSRLYKTMSIGAYTASTTALDVALVSLELARTGDKRRHLSTASRMLRGLKKWAKYSPENFLGYVHLVEAEYAAVKGKHFLANSKYLSAIALLAESNHIMYRGIALERAGIFKLSIDDEVLGRKYLKDSYSVFAEWGAVVKTRQMKRKWSTILDP